jgi:DNA-binding CsgD family transcriptional regulator
MRCKEIVQFTDRQHFQQWYEPDEIRFDHPLLHASVLRAAAAWDNDPNAGASELDGIAPAASAAGDRPAHAAPFIGQISAATNTSEILTLAGQGVQALGAVAAIVLRLDLDGARIAACQVMLSGRRPCSPGIPKESILDNDPWVAYGTQHAEPAIASGLQITEATAAPLWNLAERQSLKSVMLVPAHSGRNAGRTTLLCLGSTSSGFFESEGFAQARMGGRLLAAELHAWHLAKRRQQLQAHTCITEADLALLELERQGHTSEQIAASLNVSKGSINSRFQRMNIRLGVQNRRMALQLAVECGILRGRGN